MKNFCILLNGGIVNDARVIKTIRSLSSKFQVDLYYCSPKNDDKLIFNKNVTLIPLKSPYSNIKKKIYANLLFYKYYNYYIEAIISQHKKYHYIWANDLPTLLPAYKIKNYLGNDTKLVYDSHEIYTETLNQFYNLDTNIFKKTVFKSLIFLMRVTGLRKEKEILNHVDIFITVGDAVAEYFTKTLKYKKPLVIKNCPNIIKTVSNNNYLRQEFKLKESDLIFLYQGVLNNGRALKTLINAFSKSDNHIKFIILGGGFLLEELKRQVDKNGVKNKILFKNKVDFKELFKITSSADFGVNYVEPLNKSKELASPNKVFEYIQNELPILMSKSIENNAVNAKFKIGVCTDINEKAILIGIDEIQKIKKAEFLQNLSKAKNEFNWEEQEKILLALFQ